jgi:hypothetical protein
MRYVAIIYAVILIGCTTYSGVRTKIDQRIEAAERKLDDDAKAFIATASSMLANVNATRHDPALDKVLDIINKGQIMMGAKVGDGADLKGLDAESLDKKLQDIYAENQRIINWVNELEVKRDEMVDKIVSRDVATQAVENYKFWERFKLYSILLTVVAAAATALVYMPPSFIKTVLGWAGALLSKKKGQPTSTTTDATSARP